MLIKIPDADEQFVESLKTFTCTTTAASAYRMAAMNYELVCLDLMNRKAELLRQDREIERLRSIISGARSAAALLLEKTGQLDLLD
ncbi:hypothetical protein JJQ97_12160 [Pseudomonas syringae]|uniref:hypothetical protein n=1 Tax=Pseudomonas syringae TaxID=317 RepID=UPI001916DC49|nr:hypothetical protein [Pseudomonas syringae]QQQ52891.1 hypothetical protein JJQ97_12050 [Pseudomonas syringae]QQQ52902.1 hypothetical protein JJQ97_12105 [Pseudomonas syringae]QQQ52913.1 hypothetical protein JJQ97_12160 [Pseudomonas syringae]